MNITEIRRALADLLDVPGDVTVYPGKADYGQSMGGGLDRMRMNVRVTVGAESVEAREQLDRLLAPEGVKAQIDADDTLAGRVADVRVLASLGYQTFPAPTGPQLGSEWIVEVLPFP